MKTKPFTYFEVYVFLIAKQGLSNDDVGGGATEAPHSKRYDRKLVSKPAISLKKFFGGGYRRTTRIKATFR